MSDMIAFNSCVAFFQAVTSGWAISRSDIPPPGKGEVIDEKARGSPFPLFSKRVVLGLKFLIFLL